MKRFKLALIVLAGMVVLLVGLWGLVTQPMSSGSPNPNPPEVDPAQLRKHVEFISKDCFPRDHLNVENLDRVAAYIREAFTSAATEVTDQCYEIEGRTYCNVIARFGPATKEIIVVGAHYDAWEELPGADDNASGVAGLIELARLLGKVSLSMRVELVAFTLEEPPHFRTDWTGSAVHVRSLVESKVPVRLMMALEMIGTFSDEENSQRLPLALLKSFYPSRGNFIAVVGKSSQPLTARKVKRAMRSGSDLPVYSINAPESVEGIDWSDHRYYWKAGYPAVMITDTSYLRTRYYHTPKDTADRLDYRRMAKVVQGVFAAVLARSQS